MGCFYLFKVLFRLRRVEFIQYFAFCTLTYCISNKNLCHLCNLCDPTILRSKIKFSDFYVRYTGLHRVCPSIHCAGEERRARGKPLLGVSVVHRRLRSPESPHRVGFSSVSRVNLSLHSHPAKIQIYMLRNKKLLRLRRRGLCHTESTESTERFACGERSYVTQISQIFSPGPK